MNKSSRRSTGYSGSQSACPARGLPCKFMRKRTPAAWLLALLLSAAALLPALAQQDEGPILLPKKPVAKPAAEATLLVLCDLACNWKLDGKPHGSVAAGGSSSVPLSLGHHIAVASTLDGLDQLPSEIEIKTPGQTIVHFALQPVRDARIKVEQVARPVPDPLQELRDHAAGRSNQGLALYNQKRYVEALPLFQKACDGENLIGCYNLGVLYANGQGVDQDYARARSLYQKACDGGLVSSCTGLGYLFSNGQGAPPDYAQARALFQRACDGGDMLGCHNLGALYQNGQGVARDYAHARALYQQACEKSFLSSCFSLGLLYQYGQGGARDTAQARASYKKACDGGFEQACLYLRNLP
jgi:tetratricopeptide (TPR) repeat protein